jgi:hypothetical protein
MALLVCVAVFCSLINGSVRGVRVLVQLPFCGDTRMAVTRLRLSVRHGQIARWLTRKRGCRAQHRAVCEDGRWALAAVWGGSGSGACYGLVQPFGFLPQSVSMVESCRRRAARNWHETYARHPGPAERGTRWRCRQCGTARWREPPGEGQEARTGGNRPAPHCQFRCAHGISAVASVGHQIPFHPRAQRGLAASPAGRLRRSSSPALA